ncbi:coenzyme F420-0:L-glutamate ligase [Myxococcus vastator]|uniref:coenzyme F420-0:L-glutamate ligase n=1 Tax=Myxococcus vastator TaxID=2709664 RepID=UPI0013D40A6B|nr:coenzyme F420-0:L-glutamate ligase [Myxococcus vastator]
MSNMIVKFDPAATWAPASRFEVTHVSPEPRIAAGELLMRVRAGERELTYPSPLAGNVVRPLVGVGQHVAAGEPVFLMSSTSVAPDLGELEQLMDEKIWNLAVATNAVFKGLLGSMGASGQIASRTVPVKVELPTHQGVDTLIQSIAEACAASSLEEGDVVVVAEKPFPVAQGRLVPYRYIYETDPKKMGREDRLRLLAELQRLVSGPVDEKDLILADSYLEDPARGEQATVGAHNHNRLAAQLAEAVRARSGVSVDVIISDTDTGIDIRETIIGCITLGATPVGATRGLSFYEAMRASCAAEFTRGSKSRIPIVICKPAHRCRRRPSIGEFRGYDGKLDFDREGRKIAFD